MHDPPMHTKPKVVVGAILLAACGSDSVDLAAELLHDAAVAMQDAAEALGDAGTQTADAAAPDAAAPEALEPLEVACNLEHHASATVTNYYAALELPMESVRAVWVCDQAELTSCTGGNGEYCSTIHEPECAGAAYYYARGKLYVPCGQATDGQLDRHWQKVRVYR